MKNVKGVLVTKEELQQKVKELGAQLTRDYDGKKPLLIGVLKGCVVFFSDLIREVKIDCQIDFMVVSSYGAGTTTSGEVKVIKDVNTPLENRHVIIVEDIVDSGVTLNYLVNLLKFRGAQSVEICTLLDKPERRKREVYPKYKGFVIPNEFVIGYGLDYDEKYRNLPEICIMNTPE
ncbi:MAG: hypoxanthine phosphoribosyltransferase [Clostridia bacterium]|nr:hypoxanthine phosphoribosyltransferase [Clostridia bacterium]